MLLFLWSHNVQIEQYCGLVQSRGQVMLERVCWKPCAVASVAFEVDLVAAEEGVERFSWLVKDMWEYCNKIKITYMYIWFKLQLMQYH